MTMINYILYHKFKKKFKNILSSVDINLRWVYNIFIKLIKLFKLKRYISNICYITNQKLHSSCIISNKLEDYKKNIGNYSCESVWCVSLLYDLLMVMRIR